MKLIVATVVLITLLIVIVVYLFNFYLSCEEAGGVMLKGLVFYECYDKTSLKVIN